jgi:hypothetical protein
MLYPRLPGPGHLLRMPREERFGEGDAAMSWLKTMPLDAQSPAVAITGIRADQVAIVLR